MKMKNKIFGILITLVIMIGVMASQVNAANISASSTEVNKGDTVVVTVNLDKESQAVQFVLNYDAENFEYVKGSASSSIGEAAMAINDKEAGTIRIAASSISTSTTSVSFTFTAKETTDASEFTVSNLITENREELTNNNVTVKVVEKAEEPTTPEEPTNPGDQGEVETPSTDTPADTTVDEENGSTTNTETQKVDENGNVITKLPQTGTSIVTVAGVIAAVVVVAAIAVRKLRK